MADRKVIVLNSSGYQELLQSSDKLILDAASEFKSNVHIDGNLTVTGTSVTFDTVTLTVDDINIELGAIKEVHNIAVTPENLAYTLSDGSNSVTTSALGASPTIATLVTAIEAASGYSSLDFTVTANINNNGIHLTYKTLGAQSESATLTKAGGSPISATVVTNVSDASASGGGFTLYGTTPKTFNWINSTGSWTSSENINLASGKDYKINGTSVLTHNTLGSGVTASSLTSVGTITTGTWNGTAIGQAYGGTGHSSFSNGQLLIGKADGTLAKAFLTQGTNTVITNGDGSIEIVAKDTTYTISAEQTGQTDANPDIKITAGGNGSTVASTVALVGGGGTTVTRNSASQITISSAGDQSISATQTGDRVDIELSNNGGSVTLFGGTATTVTRTSSSMITIDGQDTTYSAATTSAAGLMSATDKTQLDALHAGSNVNYLRSNASDDFTGTLAHNNPGDVALYVRGGDSDTTLLRVSSQAADGTTTDTSGLNGFSLVYKGTGSNNNNSLDLYSDNQSAQAQTHVYSVTQDGVLDFKVAPTISSNAVLTSATTFGGDVSGTYNAIVVADNSHDHTIANITSLATTLAGKYATSGGTLSGQVTIDVGQTEQPLVIEGSANEKIALKEALEPRIVFYENTTEKAHLKWSRIGYLELKNAEDASVLRVKDALAFSMDGSTFYDVFHSGIDVDLSDSNKIKLGTGDELQIYHDGQYSTIKNTASGPPLAVISDTGIDFKNSSNTTFFDCGGSGGYEHVTLKYGGAQKLSTVSSGVFINGKLTAYEDLEFGRNATNPKLSFRGGGWQNTETAYIQFSTNTLNIECDNNNSVQNSAIAFTVDSQESMRIDSSGRVGIGNTAMSSFTGNASDNLVVGSGSGGEGITVYSATDNQGSITFADGTSGDAAYRGAVEYSHTADSMSFRTAGTGNRMVINSSGNVGIGTTDVQKRLHVRKDGDSYPMLVQNRTNAASTCGIALIATGSDFADGQYASVEAISGGVGSTAHSLGFRTCVSGGTPSTAMRIDSEGEMSLLGGSSSGSLHFWEGCNVTGNSDTARLGHGKNGNALIYTNASTPARGVFAIGTSSTVPFVISTNNAERMRIDSSGNTGIGVTNPGDWDSGANKLVVGSSTDNTGITINTSHSTNCTGTIAFATDDASSSGNEKNGAIVYVHNPSIHQFGMMHFSAGRKTSPYPFTISGRGRVGVGTNDPQNTFVASSTNNQCFEVNPSSTIRINNIDRGNSNTWLPFSIRANDFTLVNSSDTDVLTVASSGNVGIRTATPGAGLGIFGDDLDSCIKLRDESNYAQYTGPQIFFQGKDSTDTTKNFATIKGLSDTANTGLLTFETRVSGTNTEALRIDSSSRLLVNASGYYDLHRIPVTPEDLAYTLSDGTNSVTTSALGASPTIATLVTAITNASGYSSLEFTVSENVNGVDQWGNSFGQWGTPYAGIELTYKTTGIKSPIATLTKDGGSPITATAVVAGEKLQVLSGDAAFNGVWVGRGGGDSGELNVAVGGDALYANTTGSRNTAVGQDALEHNTTGYNNTAIGQAAMWENTTGYRLTAVGQFALGNNTTGNRMAAVGEDALAYNTTGYYNTAFGYYAQRSNTTGMKNTAIGNVSLYYNTTGTDNTAIGQWSMYTSTTGNYNTAVGATSLYRNTTGESNTIVGYRAAYFNTTGRFNTSIGGYGGWKNTTGENNVACGYNALQSNTTGNDNTAIGNLTLYYGTAIARNTAVGRDALHRCNTNDNVAVGHSAARFQYEAEENTCVGTQSLYRNISGSGNVAVGFEAARGSMATGTTVVGAYNTAIGYKSLQNFVGGSHNVAIGHQAGVNVTSGLGNFIAGSVNGGGTYQPVFDITTEHDRVVIGHTSTTNAYIQVAWTVNSDARDKMNFSPVPHGLDFINQLQPTAYQFKVDRDTEEPKGPVRYGFKAQDILAIEGDNPVIIDTEDADKLKMSSDHLLPILVKAIQELSAENASLNARLDAAGI